MSEDKEKEKKAEIVDVLNMRVLGLDIGELLKNWLGVTELGILRDPAQAEAIKKRIEEQRAKLKDAQEQLSKKFGDAIRFDYDIKVSSLLGGESDVRIGGGKFFETLDQLARERAKWGGPVRLQRKPVPYKKQEGVIEPYTEVIEGEKYLEVIAELPGVEEKDIEVKVQPDKVLISATGSGRTYRAEVALPVRVSEEPLERSYQNGVMKVRLGKSEPSQTQ